MSNTREFDDESFEAFLPTSSRQRISNTPSSPLSMPASTPRRLRSP